MGQSGAGADDTDADSAAQVRETNDEAASEDAVASVLGLLPDLSGGEEVGVAVHLTGQDNCHNDSVDGDSFAEND